MKPLLRFGHSAHVEAGHSFGDQIRASERITAAKHSFVRLDFKQPDYPFWPLCYGRRHKPSTPQLGSRDYKVQRGISETSLH